MSSGGRSVSFNPVLEYLGSDTVGELQFAEEGSVELDDFGDHDVDESFMGFNQSSTDGYVAPIRREN